MKLFGKINDVLGFTPSERKIIFILIGAFLLGWGLKWFKESGPRPPAYDYSAVDSEFAARSNAYAADRADTAASSAQRRLHDGPRKRHVGKVNINTASKEELIGLPGIGEAMAERIILFREDHGPFVSVELLAGVKGIGRKKLERLVPLCMTDQ